MLRASNEIERLNGYFAKWDDKVRQSVNMNKEEIK